MLNSRAFFLKTLNVIQWDIGLHSLVPSKGIDLKRQQFVSLEGKKTGYLVLKIQHEELLTTILPH